MQSFDERRRLVEAYGERRHAASVLAACAAALLVILGVAASGWLATEAERLDGKAQEHQARTAEAHRKQVFDERRSRYEAKSESRDVAERSVERAPSSARREELGL